MVACTLLTTISLHAQAANRFSEIHPYQATYQLSYKGRPQSYPKATLEALGNDRYRYRLEAKGDKGIAWMLRASTLEISEFSWNQGQPQPILFRHHLKHLGKSDRWDADFNWNSNIVTVQNNSKTLALELIPGTNDPFTFLLSLQRAVANDETEMKFLIVDKKQIEHKSYRVSGIENLSTSLGCLPTIKVERVYPANSNRHQYNWLAPDFDYMVVRNESGKKGKLKAALEIKKLTFNGLVIATKDRCKQTFSIEENGDV